MAQIDNKRIPKDNIKIRLTDSMKEWLFKKSEEEGVSVSSIIRDLIQNAMK